MGGKNGTIAARNGKDVARWAAKTALFWAVVEVSRSTPRLVQTGEVGLFAPVCGCSRCWRG